MSRSNYHTDKTNIPTVPLVENISGLLIYITKINYNEKFRYLNGSLIKLHSVKIRIPVGIGIQVNVIAERTDNLH